MINYQLDKMEAKELISGFQGKFIHTEHMTQAYWEVKSGSVLPEHHHVHEQISNVLEGEFEFTVEGETKVCKAGDVMVFYSNVPHSGRAITDCKILDVFSPARLEYS